MRRHLVWADAFAERAMGGNACAVVFDAGALTVETRIAITRETRLTECAFLVGSERADFGARYYTAEGEIPLAGHPTVATCAALEDAGLLAGREAFTLEIGAGVIPIGVRRGEGPTRFTMTQPAPEFGTVHAAGEIAEIYGLGVDDVIGHPQTVSTGTPYCVTVLRSHDALRRARLDPHLLGALRARDGHPLARMMEPFLVTLQGATEAGDTFARLLMPPPLPPEDPFTGSATGSMAAYLWRHGLIESPRFRAEQGHWMGRPGIGEVEVIGPPEAIEGVRLGGPAVVLMRGELLL